MDEQEMWHDMGCGEDISIPEKEVTKDEIEKLAGKFRREYEAKRFTAHDLFEYMARYVLENYKRR